MIVIPGNNILYCDVDDTCISWNPTQEELDTRGIEITCPVSMTLMEDGTVRSSGTWTQRIVPHRVHIEQIKKHKARNHTVVVWSAGGVEWATAAVKALKIEQYVDVVISKPMWVLDDLPASEFMPKSKWLKDE